MLNVLKEWSAETEAEIREEKNVRKTDEIFLLFSMGSQFDHLIKQKLDALGVYCLVADPASVKAEDVLKIKPTGIIVSGGPASAYENPPFDKSIFDLDIPLLGICLGFQLWAYHIGIEVRKSESREFGIHEFTAKADSQLFREIPITSKVLESHGDRIEVNNTLEICGHTQNAPVSAGHYNNLWGVQFHPEVTDTEFGSRIFENFCFGICGAKDTFPAFEAAKLKVAELRKQVKGKRVIIALSGGCDSSVVAYLLKEAFEERPGHLKGIYIKGIDRPDDEEHVLKYFSTQLWIDVKIVDVSDKFLEILRNISSMHEKRVAMREIYKKTLESEATEFNADFIAQGTLYTDISESGGGYASGARKAQIKLHHNVNLGYSVPELEPLADCVKDSARNIGRALKVPEPLLVRHPFPGPGLIVRIEGEVTRQKLCIARKADKIYIEELRKWKINSDKHERTLSKLSLYDEVWQAGAVVTNSITTCSKGDDASEGCVIALWAVWSVNGFTARAAELPYLFLKKVSQRLTNEIREVGAVTYRISDKPPATIEWG